MSKKSQYILPFRSIENNVVFMKDGSMRSVLSVSSLNFGLKSEVERDAIIFEYQNFLNSLDFPLQIVVSSRLANIDGYLQSLQQMLYQQTNQLLALQTQEYINFIQETVQGINLITTDFYIVIPFYTSDTQTEQGGMKDRIKQVITLGGVFSQSDTEIQKQDLARYVKGLLQRTDYVASTMHHIGLKTKMLTTEELLVLYWTLYNTQDLKKDAFLKSIFEYHPI